MKKINFVLILFMIPSFLSYSQDDSIEEEVKDTIVKNWNSISLFGLNGTQSSFVNWSAGGRNNISVLGYISLTANYKKDNLKWDNSLDLALGGIQYIGVGASKDLQKTDDKIDFASNFGVKMKDHWYYSILGSFKTQFMDGFAFPNVTDRVSSLMAPGYFTLALGMDYSPNENFSVFISPLASKMTFVTISKLADAGAYGVQAAEYDGLGNLIKAGEKFRGEFGAYVKIKYNKTLAKNIDMKSKLEMFSNYVENPENIDVNADVIFAFKVNDWFSASLNWTLIYDHDINITDIKGNTGPRTQFKSVLGLGVSYAFKNN